MLLMHDTSPKFVEKKPIIGESPKNRKISTKLGDKIRFSGDGTDRSGTFSEDIRVRSKQIGCCHLLPPCAILTPVGIPANTIERAQELICIG